VVKLVKQTIFEREDNNNLVNIYDIEDALQAFLKEKELGK
jgi:hypothetical protein